MASTSCSAASTCSALRVGAGAGGAPNAPGAIIVVVTEAGREQLVLGMPRHHVYGHIGAAALRVIQS